jgi:hypothetical protein
MPETVVLMPGSNRDTHRALHAVAADFGWTVDITNDLSAIVAAQKFRTTVAVFFAQDALGPDCSRIEQIRQLSRALPKARLVICRGFSESIDWTALSDGGAFHELWFPLQENEVRLCLGFVWESEKRMATARGATAVPPLPPARARASHALSAARAGR